MYVRCNSIIIQSDNKVQFLSTFRLFCDSTLPFSIGFFVACLMYATRVVQGNYRLSGYPVGQLCIFLPLMHETQMMMCGINLVHS